MLHTHQDAPDPNRPIARHYRKPYLDLVITLVEMRLTELPATSLRRQVLERMIERVRD